MSRGLWRGLILGLTVLSLGCRRQHPLAPYIAYVLNQQSATLAAVNLADFRVTGTLPLVTQPERVLIRPGSHQLFVVSQLGKISVVEFPDLHRLSTLDVGASARDLQFSADGHSAYVLDPADHELVFVDSGSEENADTTLPKVASRLRLPGMLRSLALSPDGATLVVMSENPDQVTLINTKTRAKMEPIRLGSTAGPAVILPDNSKVFIADLGEKKISVVSLPQNKLYSSLKMGAPPIALLLKPDGGEIFALSDLASTMMIVDAFHDNVERTFSFGSHPVAGVFRRDMSLLYVANSGDGSVQVLDVQTREVVASVHVGMSPVALALTPDPGERLLVVADRAASSLDILQADAASLANDRSPLLTTVQVGAAPIDVVIPNQVSH
jgi:YVTN family beta-propeller protein